MADVNYSVVDFNDLSAVSDGKTLLYTDGQVCKSKENLSELIQSAVDKKVENKLDTSAFSTVSGNFATTGELNTTSSTLVNKIDYVSGQVDNKLDTTVAAETYLTQMDASTTYQSKGNYLSANALDGYATETWVNEQGFLTEHQPISADDWNESYETVTANSAAWSNGAFVTAALTTGEKPVPNVPEPSNKVIYLTKDADSEIKDPYTEWIYSNKWEIIGETTVDLSDYYKKSETSSKNQLSTEFDKKLDSSAAETTYAPIDLTATVNTLTGSSATWNEVSAKFDSSAMTAYYTKSETIAALDLKEDKIFVAEYNVTPYADIKAAYDAGKQIVCKYNPLPQFPDLSIFAYLTQYAPMGNEFCFATNYTDNLFHMIKCQLNNGWARSDYAYQKVLTVGTDLEIVNNVIGVRTNDCTANSAGYAFAEGGKSNAAGQYSHAEGSATRANGNNSHTEGSGTRANGNNSHAEGEGTSAIGQASHTEGYQTSANGDYSHTEGYQTTAEGQASHAEGSGTSAYGKYSHTEGFKTSAEGNDSHSEGNQTSAIGQASHAEGSGTNAKGEYSHAEGYSAFAAVNYTHAEGWSTRANGLASHTECSGTSAIGQASHAEGGVTSAAGNASHAEGYQTTANGLASHAEGVGTSANGAASHAEGSGTKAYSDFMHVGGAYNFTTSNALFVLGNGTADNARSDAFIVTSAGNTSANDFISNGVSLSGMIDLYNILTARPLTGTYTLKCVNGTLSWVEDSNVPANAIGLNNEPVGVNGDYFTVGEGQ